MCGLMFERKTPQDPQLYYKRGLTRYSKKEYKLALKDLKAAIQYDPYPANLADIYYHLAVQAIESCVQPVATCFAFMDVV